MALPISPTPVLRGKEAASFLTRMHENENKPVSIIPTPKLDQVAKLVKEYASSKK
ncbi:hypothetical protein X792_05140 [Dehalococcoides mccartyi CG1]|jgi:hypothetical protein|uniref:hypothetical protein n=1 Tax=Dehalococcoides mccartyi TaxID=61435 RepID=UPI0004E044D1|nr:hypothetical protein [Dehalococcoides mccartyi]AII58752.1 hypothetical protein X792_05140 [Dehalococcoides mccartyi CG1]